MTTQADFATQLDQTTFNPFTYTLEINGSTTSGSNINVIAGSVALGPYPSNRVTLTSGTNNQYTVDGQISFTLNQGSQGATVQVDQTLPSRCADITTSIQTLSQTLAQLSSNNNVTMPTQQPGPLNLIAANVDVNGIAIFNVAASDIFDSSKVQQIQLTPQNSNLKLVVINVYGTSVSWSGSSLSGSWFNNVATGRSHTVWNFPEATDISFDSNMKGAVLAPFASVTTTSNVDGAIAVKSLVAGGEVHLPSVVLPDCTTAPTQTTTPGQIENKYYLIIAYY